MNKLYLRILLNEISPIQQGRSDLVLKPYNTDNETSFPNFAPLDHNNKYYITHQGQNDGHGQFTFEPGTVRVHVRMNNGQIFANIDRCLDGRNFERERCCVVTRWYLRDLGSDDLKPSFDRFNGLLFKTLPERRSCVAIMLLLALVWLTTNFVLLLTTVTALIALYCTALFWFYPNSSWLLRRLAAFASCYLAIFKASDVIKDVYPVIFGSQPPDFRFVAIIPIGFTAVYLWLYLPFQLFGAVHKKCPVIAFPVMLVVSMVSVMFLMIVLSYGTSISISPSLPSEPFERWRLQFIYGFVSLLWAGLVGKPFKPAALSWFMIVNKIVKVLLNDECLNLLACFELL
eukprot:TRINITY_DN2835_c0_g1_i1.p1 TRINITY_DN2835_c0_g1~~TRINITY_DN2835_c0_g1_i1.p1  ORF type:complete len:344 (-),score=-53.51 TRINITY_DN2835_c0_g1_i1:47-1078(-)